MNNQKVVIGLSGGVDSSVAAALLIEQGYEVEGVYLECYNEPGCRTDQDKKDALKVAIKLGIRFQELDFRKEYKEKVIEYFYAEYEAGRTPNPDVMCNREIKFGIFYDWALRQAQGKPRYDYVATGHYCRIATCKETPRRDLQGVSLGLQRARDESKDQSYFLWQIPQDHLEHILFPLGDMLKSEVRVKANELGLLTASKPDSMGICFIGKVDVRKLLKDRLGEKPGEVVMKIRNTKSEIRNSNFEIRASSLEEDYVVVGRHKGLWFYTVGSRGGFTIDPKYQKPDMEPLYVIGKDKEKNQLIVGKREETMSDRLQILDSRIQWEQGKKMWVRIRNLGELIEVEKVENNTVFLKEKIFGVASGQSAVFYDKDGVLVAGSIIV